MENVIFAYASNEAGLLVEEHVQLHPVMGASCKSTVHRAGHGRPVVVQEPSVVVRTDRCGIVACGMGHGVGGVVVPVVPNDGTESVVEGLVGGVKMFGDVDVFVEFAVLGRTAGPNGLEADESEDQ